MKSSIQKWITRSAFCTLAITATATAQAQTASPASDSENSMQTSHVVLQQLSADPAKFRLHVTDPKPGKMVLKITDREGNTLLDKRIAQTSFAQTFDLSLLRDGVYTFTLQKGKEVVKKVVQLNTDYVTIKKASIR